MDFFHYRNGELFCEDVPLKVLVERLGTPLFVYSKNTLKRHFFAFDEAFSFTDHIVCFSVKSLSNIAILHLVSSWGGGFDIVSGGELFRVIEAGGNPQKTVFSGVGKEENEIIQAVKAGILMINVESLGELELVERVGKRMEVTIPISIRVNPDVDPKTHPYISTGLKKSKFGIDVEDAVNAYKRAMKLPHVNPIGIDFHIGSQITDVGPFTEAAEKIMDMAKTLSSMGMEIRYLDLGGGLGIRYKDEEPPHPKELGSVLKEKMASFSGTVIIEPGRAITGNAGVYVTKVLYRKEKGNKTFIITDGGMNDIIRPALYNAYHEIIPIAEKDGEMETVDIVGPICETGDFLGKSREMPVLKEGDLLAVRGAGAYCSTMSSNYNSRKRSPEVLVDGDRFYVIRERESFSDLITKEGIPGDLEP